MASQEEVKQYFAYWFQLGKKVVLGNGVERLLPQPVIRDASYSPEFEQCWQRIISPTSGDCYLEGTHETIAELLTPAWDLTSCGRCEMPVPMRSVGMPVLLCPCNDLPSWPNTELPSPRQPVDTQVQLKEIRDRLLAKNE